nr:glucose-fructose oxidoreductase [uncultured bacterium]
MSDLIRWGILSTANIGRKAVVPAIQKASNSRLAAVASRDHAKAQNFASDFAIPRVHDSYEALLADTEVDAVYIPLPNSMHKAWVIKAAEAGKHILCEKPLGLNARECLSMAEAAAHHGVKLMEAFMYRFHPRTEAVFEMMRNHSLGEVNLIRSSFTFKLDNPSNIRLNPELGGGSLMDVGCYCVNVCRSIYGQEPLEAQAFAYFGKSGVDEQMVASLRFPGERYAQFHSALTLPRRQEYEVIGAKGQLKIADAFVPGTSDVAIDVTKADGTRVEHSFSGVDHYQLMVEHFADCIRLDKDPRYSANEAAANMRVIEALYASALNHGKPTAIEHFSAM